ncbi:DUF3558 domain-containing protein [Streptomyces rishiriensis]|uniref:DUF3558 domain-containing protein n=1 Tax=Streptomyces rishiriensis TaxID=68264 RepID=A0ABU0NU41_STRRH|nr:DUF3558 domain-containing protein [Streptomyces rishiriensis]MDQ0582661.1 hypothetical protein [Streptomyces rishiriensis]
MSEGTMQRRAQRDGQFDQREQRAERVNRAGGLNRLLAAAVAVPVMLIAAGCSSDSGSGDDAKDTSASTGSGSGAGSTASAAPTVQAAAYRTLPEACAVVTRKTLTELVPKGAASGKEGTSSDTAARASCSWSSLANKGVKGSQFRWLNVSLLRFESDATTGDGESQAKTYYAKQVKDAQAVTGAKNVKSAPVTATGDEATSVRYDLKKTEGAFKQQTVVVRVENVVLTLDYNGAGLAGDKSPSAETLTKSAEKAAKEAVAAVRSANGEGGGGGSDPSATSPSPSTSASAAPKATPSKSSSATPKATASKAAAAAPKASASAKS